LFSLFPSVDFFCVIPEMSRARFIALLLALGTLLIFWPATRNGFMSYDDGDYVTENSHVQNGLNGPDIEWAFTTFHAANWHPLTWLSHQLDCELFGLNASAQHAVNVLFHAANTVLLFVVLLRLTKKNLVGRDSVEPKLKKEVRHRETLASPSNNIWPSAFVAALFGWHPLHVESVAWISERKDVLSTFFALLTLIFYERFVAQSKIKSRNSKKFYSAALLAFACGLMSKPMLVTLPFVMLLLDYWPLARVASCRLKVTGSKTANLQPSTFNLQLLLEKIPFFTLTAASCVITYIAQSHGAVKSLQAVPVSYRLENAPVALANYLLKIFWPTHLAVIYPMPNFIPAIDVAISAAVLIFITIAVWLARKSNPFLLMGWFWFVGTLVPVIGLVKVGDAAMADRYTYIPSIGLFIAIAFGAEKISRKIPNSKIIFSVAAFFILASCVALTERQLTFWHDDKSLFGHALRVTKNNADAEINFGAALEAEGNLTGAMQHYREAVRIAPMSADAHANLANLLDDTGHPDEALQEFQTAIQLDPKSVAAHNNYGTLLVELGRYDEATQQYENAMQLDATDWHTPFLMAKVLLKQSRDAEAIPYLKKALALAPDNLDVLIFAAQVLATDENANVRDGQIALQLAQNANALTGGAQPVMLDTLAMADAELGKFDEAQTVASNAIAAAQNFGATNEVFQIRQRLELYKNHQPFRQAFTNAPAKNFSGK
jgi:Tfp pilus assembly protein PilF